MKLYILKPQKNLDDNNNPWFFHFSKIHCFIILANNEDEARSIADKNSGLENNQNNSCWLDPKLSLCQKVDISNINKSLILSYIKL